MGDRSNICLHYEKRFSEPEQTIWLYGHWTGVRMANVLQDALKRRHRWDDAAYLARIIANELFAPHIGEETGFGLSPYMCDNERPILHVYLKDQHISVKTQRGMQLNQHTYESFCGLDNPASTMGGEDA